MAKNAEDPTVLERLERQRRRLDSHAERLDNQRDRLGEIEHKVNQLRTVYLVLEHQMASLETRMQQLDERLEAAPVSTEPERVEARSLVDEIREEHRRIRTRFGVVARYEERIRRLEKTLEPTPDP